MGWHRPDEESRADHYRDTRKHDDRPDDFPLRLDRPITTAQEIAVCVRGMKNIAEAAELIDEYANMVAAGARVDQHKETTAKIMRSFDPKEPV